MAKPLVPEELWRVVEPLLPRRPDPGRRRGKLRRGGRPPLDDRKALTGIVFVLRTGIQWDRLPAELGCGSGMTCWRRLRDWRAAGVWGRLHRVLLDRLNAADKIDWSRAVVDTTSVRAMQRGKERARAPWTAGRRGRSTGCSSTARAVSR